MLLWVFLFTFFSFLFQTKLAQVIGDPKSKVYFLGKTKQDDQKPKRSVVLPNLSLHSIRLPIITKPQGGLQNPTSVYRGLVHDYNITSYF